MARDNIRNFCIIAHIDHGKSTLSDRILELTKSVDERTMEDQILDNMDIERERGITIKARAVTMNYTAKDGKVYEFNLIDTPGHVDFAYEVSRSLAACEGAILVVDATQGVEAQTLANTYMALEHDLELVPILNKIDLPSAHPDEVAQEVEDVIGLPCLDAPRVSAKTGLNIDQVLERVVSDIPAPSGDPDAPLKALIFDSIYDSYKGVIVYIRVFEGTVKPGDTIRLMATGAQFTLVEVGHMGATSLTPCDQLQAGEVGYLTASIKTVQDTRVGDTVTLANNPTPEALPGYRQVKPMVFCGIYPADGAKYPDLKDALEKLQLNDASLTFELETSAALGFGFRCGFLGLLHMEIITERLEREFDLDLITTTPSVRYRLTLTDGTVEMIDNPSSYPDPSNIVKQEEPFVDVHLYTPNEYVGSLMDLCQNKRGVLIDMKYMDDVRVDLHYALPLGEIVYDFFDAIKSRSRGYASYDYEFKEYRESDLVKLDFLLNGDPVDALSMIVFRDNAYAKGRRICEKLRDNIPRNLFEIPVQAAIGGKIIARETVKAMRKDVLAKCYGGDISRKKKLLEKQKEGKKKMRQLGSVSLPSEAFTAVLKLDSDDTFNFVVSILYTQLFNLLCDKADDVYGGRLPVHVRCLLDEFANIGQIPKFEKLIATIRSREISASIILQSQSQLKAIYKDNADTIVGNCDTTLFLGGKEKTTLKEMSEILGKETIDSFNTSETRGRELSHGLNYQKLGKQLMSEDEIAVMDGGKCILQLRGVRPFFSEKYDITKHPKYKYLSDFDKNNAFDMEKHLRRRPAIVKPDEVFDYYEVDEADFQEDTE